MKLADKGAFDQTLLAIIRANVREPDQLIGDIYALATCNEIGHRRLMDMMAEFSLADLSSVSDFILTRSRWATLTGLTRCSRARLSHMRIDGYSAPVDLRVSLSIEQDRIICDWAGTSGDG